MRARPRRFEAEAVLPHNQLKVHSRLQRPRSFWSAPRIATSGQPLPRSNTGSPRFTDFPSLCACSELSLTNLIGSGLNSLCLKIYSKPECRWTWPEVRVAHIMLTILTIMLILYIHKMLLLCSKSPTKCYAQNVFPGSLIFYLNKVLLLDMLT